MLSLVRVPCTLTELILQTQRKASLHTYHMFILKNFKVGYHPENTAAALFRNGLDING